MCRPSCGPEHAFLRVSLRWWWCVISWCVSLLDVWVWWCVKYWFPRHTAEPWRLPMIQSCTTLKATISGSPSLVSVCLGFLIRLCLPAKGDVVGSGIGRGEAGVSGDRGWRSPMLRAILWDLSSWGNRGGWDIEMWCVLVCGVCVNVY